MSNASSFIFPIILFIAGLPYLINGKAAREKEREFESPEKQKKYYTLNRVVGALFVILGLVEFMMALQINGFIGEIMSKAAYGAIFIVLAAAAVIIYIINVMSASKSAKAVKEEKGPSDEDFVDED